MNDNFLWKAIYELYELLIENNTEERSYQNYFEQNLIVFSVLGFDVSAPFEKSSGNNLPFDPNRDFKPEPDFICGTYDSGELCIFELKTPFVPEIVISRSKGKRKKFRAQVEEYISQSTEYAESIRERSEARDIVKSILGMTKISTYRILLLYGLGIDNNMSEVAKLADSRKIRTQILCYDDLLNTLIERYYFGRGDFEQRPGCSFISHVIISKNQLFSKAYICDIGKIEKDRLSFYVEKNYLVFEAIDSNGTSHKLSSPYEINKPTYLRFEFSNDDDGIYLSLNVNNKVQDTRIGNIKLEYKPDFSSFYIGSDLDGEKGACFQALEYYVSNHTMEIEHKLGSYHYFLQKTKTSTSCVEFDGTKHMMRDKSGNMIQQNPSKKPIFREKFGYKEN